MAETMLMTNRQYAQKDLVFRKACELAKVKPTQRQVSKYRMRKGSAYLKRRDATEHLEFEKRAKRNQRTY